MNILQIEDNPGDILLLQRAVSRNNEELILSTITTGDAALSYFTGVDDENTPDLVLCDLNLPNVSGHELLKFIKESQELKHIPFVIFSSSSTCADIKKSYRFCANAYITKPNSMTEYNEIISAVVKLWISNRGSQDSNRG